MYAKFISFLNQPVKSPGLKNKYNPAIEQYRGLCALLVMMEHGTGHTDMLFKNFTWPLYFNYFGAGFLSVIMFFCISGYVIGITNSNTNFSIWPYIKNRMVRLYPIYLISIALCVIIAGGITVYVLFGNIFFLQNDTPYFGFKVPIFINYVTWTLNSEVLYYLLFILIIYLKPKVWRLLLFMLVLTLLVTIAPPSFLAGYVNGYYFWILGLFIGWNLIKGDNDIPIQPVPILSLLFLHLCQHHLGIGQMILHTLGVYTYSGLNWLFDIPFCLMVMSILTNRDNAFLRFNKIVCFTLPTFVFIFLIATNRIFEDVRWMMCLIYWILSLAFYFERKASAFISDKLTGVGKISYALYLLHVPVALLIKKLISISNPTAEIVVKYLLWISITFSLSILLELYLQPAIRKTLTR
ncbi:MULTISPECIES: acyltransferase [unclassified Mucilaginibacter]|uniref:acyltransferase family protein n=1 Tax=unclassified Mucilaginibacter TaxID=2617802 RepID=UPI002AC9CE53|nr:MULTISPECIES: acyltransferase [unclassified Mucilaginibacter]MEB0260636.1 acyltransferase [Mucilaginibacter sp. 10I4]MEB0277479.1 acyltransferase [Mucilaginibacter sp. 10B2]MEB0302322.1 acyltransferase [Mucilaginibacter sp. 5C4]WPX24891.1 acyltransferase [Mucilaginibacter sp. 5C4]